MTKAKRAVGFALALGYVLGAGACYAFLPRWLAAAIDSLGFVTFIAIFYALYRKEADEERDSQYFKRHRFWE